MSTLHSEAEPLKTILEYLHTPEMLNQHPWVSCFFVKDAVERFPHLQREGPGRQLVAALSELFRRMMPSTPPRRSKRLDNHWGQFGLLAARYFAPLQFGTPVPSSLRDAWGRIDTAILYFVYGKPRESLAEDQIKLFQVVGDDLEYACASTLSDWHKKGLHRFTEFIGEQERFLARAAGDGSEASLPERVSAARRHTKARRWVWLTLGLLLALTLGLASLKASKIYKSGDAVYADLRQMQALVSAPVEVKTVETALPVLKRLQVDLTAFEVEARPLIWLGPRVSWIPVYGKDLASAPVLLELAKHLLSSGISAGEALQPILSRLDSHNPSLDPAGLAKLLVQAQPQLKQARDEFDRALALRESLDPDQLSPRLRGLLVDELDPRLAQADEGLSLGLALPGLLGAGSEGPQTYLLLAENEDELRPTGGFITSVGNLVVHDGSIIHLDFEDSGEQEDWSQPYPSAPWQLQEYMNSPVLILRDANWFTDFPTAALWAEYLYAYTHDHSVDGVIAFDQHFLVMVLEQLGPLDVEGAPYPIEAGNVIEYMRQAKRPPEGETIPVGWTRKEFIGDIAASLLNRLEDGDRDWLAIAEVFSRALDERHLLLQFDDPRLAAFAAGRGWDNAVRPGAGDFLMVTDTNIGFNKTNALVDTGLSYDVDLSDLDSPTGTLTVSHKNNASKDIPCLQWDTEDRITGEEFYPIDRCYWNYLRVYRQEGVKLLDSTPQDILSGWMINHQNVPARVDALEEEIPGVTGFGTLQVIRGGQSLSTGFEFALPAGAVLRQADPGQWIYRLKVQKQPGTRASPITIRMHLPGRAVLESVPEGAVLQGQHLFLQTNLRTDIELEIRFRLP